MKLRTILAACWGIPGIEAIRTGDDSHLIAMRDAVVSRGYRFALRLYVSAGRFLTDGLDQEIAVFWRGHKFVSPDPIRDGRRPSLRAVCDKAVSLGIGLHFVVSDFRQGVPGIDGGYNAYRYGTTQRQRDDIWRELHVQYGDSMEEGDIDNEPFAGSASYGREEYLDRAIAESRTMRNLGILPIVAHYPGSPAFRIPGTLDGEHLSIGNGDFTELRWAAFAETWLMPRVKPSQCARLVEIAKGNGITQILGMNFGGNFIDPDKGLLGPGRWFDTTWIYGGGGWTKTGLGVLEALGVKSPIDPPVIDIPGAIRLVNRQVDEWREGWTKKKSGLPNKTVANLLEKLGVGE